MDVYYSQLKGRGVEVQPPADEGWGGRFITLTDPDQYRLFFVMWHAGEQEERSEYIVGRWRG